VVIESPRLALNFLNDNRGVNTKHKPYLGKNGVDGITIECLGLKILFHPFKELLDRPAFFLQISDGPGIQMCCIGGRIDNPG
jgi:hypothetical protein